MLMIGFFVFVDSLDRREEAPIASADGIVALTGGPAWLIDYGDMNQRYVFDFPLTSDLRYLFDNYDVLPRPAGSGVTSESASPPAPTEPPGVATERIGRGAGRCGFMHLAFVGWCPAGKAGKAGPM